ncbi:MAG TPA: glycosyltransferase [Bacteroidota bacterium]|nr:glycosyltransferase [Bacteroidota bacterium]
MMYTTFQVVLLGVVAMVMAYLALLSLLAFLTKPRREFAVNTLRRFTIVIPAHNEAGTIERTLHSLNRIEYDLERYTVVVIADNCSDQTAEIAWAHGATVLERNNRAKRGKGYALAWAFERLPFDGDAVVVVDADSVVSRNFLLVMNFYLEQGARVIQANDLPLPQPNAWSSEVTRIGMTLYNYARPLGRQAIGCSAGLRGNGMCFSADVLRDVPWKAFSLTEDVEYGLQLLLCGIPVTFAPEAAVLASMPTNAKNALTQRARWEAGRYPVIKKYAIGLLIEAMRRRSVAVFDAFIDLLIPPFVNLFAISFLFFLLTLLTRDILSHWIVIGWVLVLMLGIIHVLLGLASAGSDRDLYRALLYIPRYVAWKIGLYLKMLLRGSRREWIRTTREVAGSRT